jgi:hypothetical protein
MAADTVQHKPILCDEEDGKVQLSDDEEDEEANNNLSQESFEEKVGAYTGKGLADALDKKILDDKSHRFSDRLAGKNNDVPVLDRAINLAAAKKNLEGTSEIPCTIVDSSDSTLFDISNLLGVDLGILIDLVKHNLNLIRSQEQARVNLFIQNRGDTSEVPAVNPEDTVLQPEVVDSILKDLLALNYESNEDYSMLDFDAPLAGLMEELNRRKPEVFLVKTPVKTVLRGRRTKKQKC